MNPYPRENKLILATSVSSKLEGPRKISRSDEFGVLLFSADCIRTQTETLLDKTYQALI